MSLSRQQWQDLARDRIREARTLLTHGRPSSAHYLAGFSVECALKACIAKTFRAETWPRRDFVKDIYQHDLGRLVKLAGLDSALETRTLEDVAFGDHWAILRNWDNEGRYRVVAYAEAETTVRAVCHPESGVLLWIETFW